MHSNKRQFRIFKWDYNVIVTVCISFTTQREKYKIFHFYYRDCEGEIYAIYVIV